jgi:hypothetical protein
MLAAAENDGVFELVGGAWVPAKAAPSNARELGLADRRSPTEAALAAEVVVLRATVEALMARVARLERKVAYDLPRERVAAGRSGAHTIDGLGRSAALADAPPVSCDGRRPPAARPELPLRFSQSPASVPDGPAAQPVPVAVAPGAASKPPLRLPPLVVLVNVLKDLAGQEIPLKETRGAPPDWTTAPGRYFAAWLVDDDGADVGGVLCDVEAVARLGGALLMLPRSEIDAQASAGTPSDDVKMAASEICNNLSGPVNDVPGNPHVRALSIAALTERIPDWLETARVRLACVHPGGGKLVLVGR